MISALGAGRSITSPATGTTESNKPCTRATVACDVGGAADVMVGLFVKDEGSIYALSKAKKGECIVAQGNLAPNSYIAQDGTEKHGLSLGFARLLTVRQPKRERE